MNRPLLAMGMRFRPDFSFAVSGIAPGRLRLAVLCAAAALLTATTASAQVTVDTKTGVVTNDNVTVAATVDRRYAQIEPTHVDLSKIELDPKTRMEVIRLMQAEQGFAMRPIPRGHKGLKLNANGKLEPAGENYLEMVTSQGISAKPGERVVISDVKIDHSNIVFELNGGPDKKHRFLRHIQIGAGTTTSPIMQDDGQEPVGARLTLAFKGHVPELTGKEVKALLAPLISFDVKTPIQAFTDTLPKKLKDAILDHHVLVGMSTDMVLFAMGQPDNKSRETEGQMPFEEWIYGKPPKDVQFVRINGNRVIRVEIAKMGQEPVIYTKDEVEGLMRSDGSPLEASNERKVQMGDVERDPNTQAPAAPPSLRKPGETLPSDDDKATSNGRVGVMRPVQFPKQKPDDDDGTAKTDGSQPATGQQPAAASPNGSQPGTQSGGSGSGGSGSGGSAAPASGTQTTQPDSQSKPQNLISTGAGRS